MDKIIKALAKKYDLPQFVIDQVTESQFRFTRDMIKSGSFESSNHLFLGKFVVHEGVRKHWNEVNERRAKERAALEESSKHIQGMEEPSVQKPDSRTDSQTEGNNLC